MADAQPQARISELPAATKTEDSDQFEVSQGSPAISRRVSLALLKAGVKPDLTGYLTGLVGGPGIVVSGSAPVPSVSLDTLGGAGTWGDGLNIPQVTVDDHGRVTGIVLVPITPADLSGYAPLNSPTFVGTPTAPLRPHGDSNASLATSAFVQQEIAAKAPLASPAFTGTPTGPTQVVDTNTDALATCAFVQQAIASGASISVGETPPVTPRPNQLWWHSAFGQMFIFYSDADSQQWVPASPSISSIGGTPPGASLDFFGGTVPAGWYLCDGALKDRTLDAPLFAAIGTSFGAGDGSTTFALPDCRGRVLAMRDYATGRLTTVADSLGATGGADNITLLANQMPSHSHAINGQADGTFVYQSWGGGTAGFGAGSGMATPTLTAGSTGGGLAHNNTQPTMAVNKLIKR